MSNDEDLTDTEGDPFEQLESDVAGREGDPFENLSEKPPSDDIPSPSPSNESEATKGDDERPNTPNQPPADTLDWADSPGDESSLTARGESTEMNLDSSQGGRNTADPLSDVGSRDGDPFEETGSLFEERDTESIDPDAVWQELASADSRSSPSDSLERTFADVSKHSYCEQCEHFSPPPEITCTHEGTDIVEFLDMETVRVVDCPIVKERHDLERND